MMMVIDDDGIQKPTWITWMPNTPGLCLVFRSSDVNGLRMKLRHA